MPRIVGSKVKINALISIIIVLLGGMVWGVSGMFLSIPFIGILKIIFDRIPELKPWGKILGVEVPTRHKGQIWNLKKNGPQCDAYTLSGGCSNTYDLNLPGACPSDLQTQYAAWKTGTYPPDGGFIWLYDSVVSCLLSGCCGGTEKAPATTATAYREAISNGLS